MVPEGWRTTTFGDVASLEYGKSLPAVQRAGGPFPVCGSNGVVGYHDESLVHGPGIVIGRKGSVGVVSWVDHDFWPIDTTYYVKSQIPSDVRWLYYAISSLRLDKLNEATGIPGLNRSTASVVRFGLPPLPEQRKIAAILSSVDDAINKTQTVIDQVQIVKRGLIQELLRRGLPGRHTRFKQTQMGEIPECWQLALLDDVLDGIDAGWSPKSEGRPARLSEWGVLRVSSVSSGRFLECENKVLDEGLEPRPKLEVKQGDVLIARASGVVDLVGRSAFVHGTRRKLMLSDKTLRLQAKKSVMRPMFLNLLLGDPRVRQQVLMQTTGSHMRNIAQRALRRVLMPVPSLEEQERIEVLELHANTRLDEERESLHQLEVVKATLMAVLLTGELRVTPDTEAA